MDEFNNNVVTAVEPALPGGTSLLDKMNEAAKPRPRPEPLPRSPANTQKQGNEDSTVADWLKSFSGQQVRITLVRTYPEFHNGRDVSGVLDHFDELIDEEYIKSRYGGGKFQIKAQTIQDNGQWRYAGARTVKIAGDPLTTGNMFQPRDEGEQSIPVGPDNSVVERAMAMSERIAQEERRRAERIEESAHNRTAGLSEGTVALMIKPYEAQVIALTSQLIAKDQQLAEKERTIQDLMNRRPDTSRSDSLLETVIKGESTKIDGLRLQFDSERRMLLESARDSERRIQERHDYEMKNKDEALAREVKNLERAFEGRAESMKGGFEARLEAKDNRLKDLERALTKCETELVELRARKEQGPLEQMKHIAEFKEMADQFMNTGKDDEEDETSTFERVMGKVMESPVVQAVGQRIVNGPAPTPLQQAQVRVQQRRLAAAEQAAAEPPKPKGPLDGIDPQVIAGAVSYMEAAVANNVPPATFAQSIRSQMPPSLLDAIQKMGIDTFLEALGLSDGSPLATQVGRTYARKVARALAGTDEVAVD